MFSPDRMTKIRDQRENDHGQYTEILDEKEVIRVSAYVGRPWMRARTELDLETRRDA
jgi:hypothetical protein